MKELNHKLIMKNFDGELALTKISPSFKDATVEFNIKYYDEEDTCTDAVLTFKEVIAINFQVLYFDVYLGAGLFGLYEITDKCYKEELIEQLMQHNSKFQGNNIFDSLPSFEDLVNNLDKFHLYQQNVHGGIFLVLCKEFEIRG